MGCVESTPAENKESRQINRELKKDKRKFQEEVKLLLLGPGESGKSTVFKQMKIIQDNGGYSETERKSYKYVVFANCITQMKVLVNAAMKLDITFEEKNREIANIIDQLPSGGDSWTPEIGQMIKQLWSDSGLRETYNKRDSLFQLNDSSAYFFDNIDRYVQPDYIPSVNDVLRARVRTTGIEEAQFKIEDFQFRMVDVGGQRCERRKWIHCFEGSVITAVIFCVGLSEYDQHLREENTQNRMKESLLLFDELCNSSWFKTTPFILFLNKTDIFQEKIKTVDLKVCFENYTGGMNFENAAAFIKARFMELNQSPHVIYSHFTCAISTENIQFVFKAVRETIMGKILAKAGLTF